MTLWLPAPEPLLFRPRLAERRSGPNDGMIGQDQAGTVYGQDCREAWCECRSWRVLKGVNARLSLHSLIICESVGWEVPRIWIAAEILPDSVIVTRAIMWYRFSNTEVVCGGPRRHHPTPPLPR